MTLSRTTETYIEFLKIGQNAYGDKIRFYEQHRSIIASLPDSENQELRLYYLIALFEVGEYQKYLDLVDYMIEEIVEENVYDFNGQDIYYVLLLNKASAHYNLFQNEQAETLAVQLKKIDPENPVNRLLLEKIYYRNLSESSRFIKAIGIALYFLSGFFIAIQILLVEPFYNQYNLAAQRVWQGVFIFATLLLLFNEIRIKLVSRSKLK